jgi:hypothetical protein
VLSGGVGGSPLHPRFPSPSAAQWAGCSRYYEGGGEWFAQPQMRGQTGTHYKAKLRRVRAFGPDKHLRMPGLTGIFGNVNVRAF